MRLRTEIEPSPAPFVVARSRRGFAAGSCFAANMADRLRTARFPVACNPLGVMYNPLSLEMFFERLAAARPFGPEELSEGAEGWFSWQAHGDFTDPDRDALLARLDRAVREGAEALAGADYVLLTLGTARVWELMPEGIPVANCHRRPASCFRRRMLSPAEAADALSRMARGPLADKDIVVTVSPVRYPDADDFLSKATLRVAVDALCRACPRAWYFPAWELLCDDLRDYRFYAPDMRHPTAQAVDYMWEKFCVAAVPAPERELTRRIADLSAAAAHRPFRPDTEAHRAFVARMRERTLELHAAYPEVDLSPELAAFCRS